MAGSFSKKSNWFKRRQPAQIDLALVQTASNFNYEPQHGYYGFKLYFPEEDEIDTFTTLHLVKLFEQFIIENEPSFDFSTIETTSIFKTDYQTIISHPSLNEFSVRIKDKTEFCLNCIGLAIHQTQAAKNEKKKPKTSSNLGLIRARLVNFEPIQQLNDIRVHNFGKLVAIRGTVIKAGDGRIMCTYLAFSCGICTGVQVQKQTENCLTLPSSCPTEGCRARSNFNPLFSSPFTRTVEWKRVKIQELIGDAQFQSGRVPLTLECELKDDLVTSCMSGDDVTITGVVKVHNELNSGRNTQQNSALSLYLDAINVVNNKNQSGGSYGASELISFTTKDYHVIQKIHAEPDVFRTLVHSLNPNIYGHEIIKAGLMLALFGGAKSSHGRSESHVLMVGDPGLGKSQMLQACANLAPRGVYVCGNTSTSSGLTVTLTREAGGEFALQAGALMLADQGCCCIDEFDKMPQQHACLLEAMEQQSISIAKSGIVCTLPTKATILAAANPSGGHYNKAKTVAENLKISSPMLSRFDLVFIILDQPNEAIDRLVSEHVMALHSGKASTSLNQSTSLMGATTDNDLINRLRLNGGEEIDHIPHCLYRKYIAYAQKYVNSSLSKGAQLVLKDFYFKLRQQYRTGDSTPITTRQLHSLIRLTQARARAELREEATKEDALDVIYIMKQSLIDVFTDEIGILDATRSQMGTGMSAKKQCMNLLALLQAEAEKSGESIFCTSKIKEMSTRAGVPTTKFFTVLGSLNLQGFLLHKGGNNYKLITT